MPNHALLQKACSLNLAAITLHPTQSAEFRFWSSLLGVRVPRPYRLFLFVPPDDCFVPLVRVDVRVTTMHLSFRTVLAAFTAHGSWQPVGNWVITQNPIHKVFSGIDFHIATVLNLPNISGFCIPL